MTLRKKHVCGISGVSRIDWVALGDAAKKGARLCLYVDDGAVATACGGFQSQAC